MRQSHPQLSGLTIVDPILTESEEAHLLEALEGPGKPMSIASRNRVVRFGPGVPHSGYTEADRIELEIPGALGWLMAGLAIIPGVELAADSVTAGWYLPGLRMRPHINNPMAGSTIAIVALAGDATMRFTQPDESEVVDVPFPRRTLIVLQGVVRWDWMHEILPITEDCLSLVFRRSMPLAP